MRWIGTSGFAYKEWKPRFYPDGLAQAKMLAHYATRLNSVEINYTFQRFPTQQLLGGWASKVPGAFTFCLKMPRRITHERRLRDCAEDLERFAGPARALGDRLGPALVQLPPALPADAELLRSFVAVLPAGLRYAFEFRHPSWSTEETGATLAAAGAAWVEAETDDEDAAPRVAPSGFAYLRLRRSAYDAERLDRWRARIDALESGGADVFCYLRHDADGANALAAESLAAGRAAGAVT